MNKNKQQKFWLERWQQHDIPFHQQQVNPDLPNYWHKLNLSSGARVLIPLCGKSLDMVWLQQQGHDIIGIELSSLAVEAFFQESGLDYEIKQHEDWQIYQNDHYQIWVADIFTLPPNWIVPVDAIYDRGALIALPKAIRYRYIAQVQPWLNNNGQILLKTVTYNQSEMDGPPYSVPPEELSELYSDFSHIENIKSLPRKQEDMQRYSDRGCRALRDETWLITK